MGNYHGSDNSHEHSRKRALETQIMSHKNENLYNTKQTPRLYPTTKVTTL